MGSNQENHYHAFISYSHVDEKEVLRLHRFLEHYPLPRSITKHREELPHSFAPIFIDRHNLSGTKLDARLHEALEQSEYLIVVCSPSSAKSSFVNDEVRYFISLGRADKVIPYIIDGMPNAKDPKEECYVSALRELNPLGADVQDLGKEKARLRVIASMLNVDLDILVQKEKRRKIRRALLVAACLAAAAAAIWIPYDYYNVPKTSYYMDYVEVKGIPQGIGTSVSKKERQDLLSCYSITKRAGKVISLCFVNQYEEPLTPAIQTVKEETPIREYTYNEDGELTNVSLENEEGKILVNWQYSNNGEEVSLRDAAQNTVDLENFEKLIAEDDLEGLEKTNGITAYKMIYDADTGYLKMKLFTAFAGSQSVIADDTGAYGNEYEYYENGQLARIYYLNQNGQRVQKSNGVYYLEYTYDEEGRVTTQIYYDEEGNRANGSGNCAELRMSYDGNTIVQEGYGADGAAEIVPTYGTHSYKSISDDHGRPASNEYYDDNQKLCNSSLGYAKCTMEYDSEGRQNKIAYWDEEDNPMQINGYYIRTKEYSSENGYLTIVQKYLDLDGNLTDSDSEVSVVKEVKDSYDNNILVENYNEEEEPTAGKEGYFRAESEVDEAGNVVKISYFNEEGDPYLFDGCYSVKTMGYDSNGLCTDVHFWDENNQSVPGPKGYAHLECSYDPWGHISGYHFYGMDENLINSIYGYAIAEYGYDENGNICDAVFFDENEEPVLDEKGVHEEKYVFKNGKVVEASYFGIDGEEILCNGVHRLEMDRDTAGNVLSIRNYGTHGESVLCKNGYFSFEKEYDGKGNLVSIAYFDTNGDLAQSVDEDNLVKVEYSYNADGGNVSQTLWYYEDDGFVEKFTVDPETEEIIEKAYYNPDQTPAEKNGVHRVECIYDDAGELADVLLYDLQNELLSAEDE